MAQLKVDEAGYTSEVNSAKTAADSLAAKNGVDKPSGGLKVRTVSQMWESYDQLTSAINKYAHLVTYDVGRFKQAGRNQVELNSSYGKKGGK